MNSSPACSITQVFTWVTTVGPSQVPSLPSTPIRPSTNGGSDSSAKNAASPARPVTR
ncbi:hypothetical protein [Nonomuraea rubra]|uniref:hypothetical protein n=1 Tax=Nonomuraea rubra TaxID=46180 RepID=UPI0031F0130B